ncbi:8180_t:CDS:2, partial [Dentiscutata erythropus]
IGKAKEAVEANKELLIMFGELIGGITVLKNKIDVLKERQEKDIDALKVRQEGLRNEIIAMLEGLRDVNHVYNANWGAILNKDKVVIPKAVKRT